MSNYALFTFQLVAFVAMAYLMHQMYRQLRRDSVDVGQVRGEVSEMVRELRRAADQINADLAARAAALQKLVDEADRKLSTNETPRAVQPARAARPTPRPTDQAGRKAPATEPRPAQRQAPRAAPPRVEKQRPEDESWPGSPAGSPVRTLPRVTASSPIAASAYREATRPAEPRAPEAVPSGGDGFVALGLEDAGKFQVVRRLAAQGMSAAEIARSTQLGREEVELIMRVSGEGRS